MIKVLGPMQVLREEHPLDIGSPRHREVLAALVVDAGRVVSTDALLERVWGDAGRGASTSNLHAVISRLRGRLQGATEGVVIATAPPGYRLDAEGAIDAVEFQRLLGRARTVHGAGDLAAAHELLQAALDLWRGQAYADIRLPFAEVEAARLDGLRLAAYEMVVDVELALGRHREALDRLPGLVDEHPLHESFRRQLMLALYRSGRQAEALDVFAEVRGLLAEELGIDPGPELRDLHQRMLAQDLDPVPPTARPGPAATTVTWHSDVVVPGDDLIGRAHDVAYLHELLHTSTQRLVTVTGVGGVGKTRLAQAVAEAARGTFPDGVALVSLAPITDPDVVVPAIGRAVGLGAAEGPDPVATVAQHLAGRRVLVVLDNAEHLLEAAPALARLVAASPQLTVLVTSRTPLRVRGELQFQLTPLSLPPSSPPGAAQDLDAVAASSAVALFLDRVRAVRPDFRLDEENAAAVGAICRRLAGIPLALELAAARAQLLAPDVILARLDQVMESDGARDLPARQRTMRAAIDWSYQLLEPAQQRLFRQLAVFADGFTLEAVEAVSRAVGGDGAGVLRSLEALVEHSLVLRDPEHPELARFRMLEPVSQFAEACLRGDEERSVRDAHLRHFLALAEATEPAFRGHGTREALALTAREHANLVAAMEWALESRQGDLGGRLVWAVWLYWWLRGHLLEGRRLAHGMLALELPDPVRVRNLAVLGAMTFAQGDTVLARSWCTGARLGRETGDLAGEAHNVAGEALIAIAEDHLDEAEVRLVETIRLTEECGLAGEWLWTLSHVWQATVRVLLGFPEHAVPLLERALDAARQRNDPLAIYIGLFTSAQVALLGGHTEDARRQLEEGIRLSLDTGDMANLAYFLDLLAVVEAHDGQPRQVALLHGAAAQMRETVGANVHGYYQPDEQLLADALAGAREALGPGYDEALAQGRGLGPTEVVALATRRTSPGQRPPD